MDLAAQHVHVDIKNVLLTLFCDKWIPDSQFKRQLVLVPLTAGSPSTKQHV